MSQLIKFDKEYNKIIVGVDEAGRGPLAGPVVAAAVIINDYSGLEEINDSKKLTEKKREKLYKIIMKNCEVGVGIVREKEIDAINILNATFKAMREAISEIKIDFDITLVDGDKKIREYDKTQEAIIKGDGKSVAIAAASVIAKVTRDRIMVEFADKYPDYGFEKHKGYGTKMHREKLLEIGPCEIHRKSFLRKILLLKKG